MCIDVNFGDGLSGGFNQSLQRVLPEVLMKQKKLKSDRSLWPKLRAPGAVEDAIERLPSRSVDRHRRSRANCGAMLRHAGAALSTVPTRRSVLHSAHRKFGLIRLHELVDDMDVFSLPANRRRRPRPPPGLAQRAGGECSMSPARVSRAHVPANGGPPHIRGRPRRRRSGCPWVGPLFSTAV